MLGAPLAPRLVERQRVELVDRAERCDLPRARGRPGRPGLRRRAALVQQRGREQHHRGDREAVEQHRADTLVPQGTRAHQREMHRHLPLVPRRRAAAGRPGPVRDHVRCGAGHGAAAHHGRSADDPGAEVNAAATTAWDDEYDAAAGGDGRQQPGETFSTEIVKPFQVFIAKKL